MLAKQFIQPASFLRRFGMKREVNVVDVDMIILFQFFNTPGTEIAPGSDKIGINIKRGRLGHMNLLMINLPEG